MSLGWNANTDSDLAGYRVYVGTAAGVYAQARGAGLSAGLATDYVVTGLQPNSTYYVAVTSYDKSGNESNYSTPVAGVAK